MLAIAPARLARFEALCQRERAPYAVLGEATARAARWWSTTATSATSPSTCRCRCCSASRRACGATAKRAARRSATASTAGRSTCARRSSACCGCPTVADKTFLITIGDRTRHRPGRARPDGRPVAGAGRRRRRHRHQLRRLHRRGHGHGRAHAGRAARRRRLGAHGRRPRRSPTSPPRRIAAARRRQAVGQLDGRRRAPGEDARLYDAVRAVGSELCPALGIAIPVGKDSMSMRTVWSEGGEQRSVIAPLSLIVSAFAPVTRRAPRADPRAVARQGRPVRPAA